MFRIELQKVWRDGVGNDGSLLLFRRQQLRGALGARQQVLAVFRGDEGGKCFGAASDQQEIIGVRCQDGIDDIVTRTHVAQIDFQAIMEEGEKVGILEDAEERQTHLALQHDANDTERRAAQGIRVLGAGRLFIDGPEADKRIELVRQGNGDGDLVFRHAVRRALRLVMIFDGGGDGRIFALDTRIFAAHQALKFREFAHGFGAQIRFGKHHGAVHQRFLRTDNACDLLRQCTNALHACTLRAELGVEGDVQRIELGHALVERLGEIEAELVCGSLQGFEIRQIALVTRPEMLGI